MVKKTYTRESKRPCSTNVVFFDQIYEGDDIYRLEYVTIYVKIAQTNDSNYYNININWSMTTFLDKIKLWVLTDHNHSDSRGRSLQTVKVVETGQPDEHNAPCIEEDNQLTYKNRYLVFNKWPSFYIIIT